MNYFAENNIGIKRNGSLWEVGGMKLLKLESVKTFIDGRLNVTNAQKTTFFQSGASDGVMFQVAEAIYYAVFDKDSDDFKDPQKLLFNTKLVNSTDVPLIGLKSTYSIMDSSMLIKDAVEIASKSGIKTLGICDNNSMGGVLEFQGYCKDNGVKPVLGVEYQVRIDGLVSPVKFYGTYEELLVVNKIVMVDNYETCVLEETDIERLPKNIYLVFNPLYIGHSEKLDSIDIKNKFYQFSTTEYTSGEVFQAYLTSLKGYIYSDIAPLWINDTYYTHKFYKESKTLLNRLMTGKSGKKSHNQEIRSSQSSFMEFESIMSDEAVEEFNKGIQNVRTLVESMPETPIDTAGFKIPKFLDSKEEELALFQSKIRAGWDKIVAPNDKLNKKEYKDRVTEEIRVISESNYISYFLITDSQYEFAREIGAYYGRGRGSGAGSLVCYLMGITDVDPIENNLLFSRFLNEGRAKKSMPDLDCDFERRFVDKVKEFLMNRYGRNNVALIGNYGDLTAKTAISRMAKMYGESNKTAMYHSKMIKDGSSMANVMKDSSPRLTKYLDKNYEALSQIEIVEGAKIQKGVHACGVLVTPSEGGMSVWDYVPVRKVKYGKFEELVLISEFDGKNCETMGLLKNDVLSLGTLDMIHDTVDLIKEKTGETVDYKSFDTKCKKTFENFALGRTSSVFQFNSPVATSYVKKAKPTSISELSVITALLRPATMGKGIHDQYADVKNGLREPEYDLLLEEVEEETLGFLIYQEQVMKAFVVLADFTDTQADDVRRAIGKKDMKSMKIFKTLFIERSKQKGYIESMATELWDKIEEFATYSFNKSHAFSYAWASFDCMYLKTHYPSHFYATALTREYSKSKEMRNMTGLIREIKDEGVVDVLSPDINLSGEQFDIVGGNIVWGLTQIKQIKMSARVIVQEREANGKFLSIVDFAKRVTIKKNEAENLILCGAFDDLEGVKEVFDRAVILKKFYEAKLIAKKDEKDIANKFVEYKAFESDLIGWSHIDYQKLIDFTGLDIDDYYTAQELYDLESGDWGTFAGVVKTSVTRKVRNGEMLSLTLESNNDLVYLTGFDAFYKKNKKDIKSLKKGAYVFISGAVKYDDFKGCKAVMLNHKTKIKVLHEA